MKEQLQTKIETFKGILLTRVEQENGINFAVQPAKDIREAFSVHSYFKRWLVDYEKIKGARNPLLEKLVKSYITEETAVFELELANSVSAFAPTSEINPMKDYINGLALAIAYEEVRFKIIGNLIDSTPNS